MRIWGGKILWSLKVSSGGVVIVGWDRMTKHSVRTEQRYTRGHSSGYTVLCYSVRRPESITGYTEIMGVTREGLED